MLHCWKLANGETVFEARLTDISILSSPIATADGRIYFASARKTHVIRSGAPRLEVLARNQVKDGGNDGPSPAMANGQCFLESEGRLWCTGKK